MKENFFIKILASIPIILVILYFIPFLGICLLILRYFIYSNRKRISTPIIILLVGILILVPKIISSILTLTQIDTVPYLSNILDSELYNINFIKYSKLLISIGVIFLILSFIFRSIFNKISDKISTGIRDYINETENKNTGISKANDMVMKEKREKAKHTNYVHCPYCGSDNILAEKNGTCKFCRRVIENENYNKNV